MPCMVMLDARTEATLQADSRKRNVKSDDGPCIAEQKIISDDTAAPVDGNKGNSHGAFA